MAISRGGGRRVIVISLRMDEQLIKMIQDQAKKEGRSFSNMVRQLTERGLRCKKNS